MAKLNDTQLILLSAASQRDNGSFYPLPLMLVDAGERVAKALAELTKGRLAEDRETSDATAVQRINGDIRYGIFITASGTAAINGTHVIDAKTSEATVVIGTPKVSKTSAVLALLQREDGAFISELIALTGWLPHTTRAALTGLRKKGHVIERSKRDDQTCYRIAAA